MYSLQILFLISCLHLVIRLFILRFLNLVFFNHQLVAQYLDFRVLSLYDEFGDECVIYHDYSTNSPIRFTLRTEALLNVNIKRFAPVPNEVLDNPVFLNMAAPYKIIPKRNFNHTMEVVYDNSSMNSVSEIKFSPSIFAKSDTISLYFQVSALVERYYFGITVFFTEFPREEEEGEFAQTAYCRIYPYSLITPKQFYTADYGINYYKLTYNFIESDFPDPNQYLIIFQFVNCLDIFRIEHPRIFLSNSIINLRMNIKYEPQTAFGFITEETVEFVNYLSIILPSFENSDYQCTFQYSMELFYNNTNSNSKGTTVAAVKYSFFAEYLLLSFLISFVLSSLIALLISFFFEHSSCKIKWRSFTLQITSYIFLLFIISKIALIGFVTSFLFYEKTTQSSNRSNRIKITIIIIGNIILMLLMLASIIFGFVVYTTVVDCEAYCCNFGAYSSEKIFPLVLSPQSNASPCFVSDPLSFLKSSSYVSETEQLAKEYCRFGLYTKRCVIGNIYMGFITAVLLFIFNYEFWVVLWLLIWPTIFKKCERNPVIFEPNREGQVVNQEQHHNNSAQPENEQHVEMIQLESESEQDPSLNSPVTPTIYDNDPYDYVPTFEERTWREEE